MADLDPFTQMYNALWQLAIDNAEFAALVKLKNRIRYDEETDRGPAKRDISSEDTPEVQLSAVGTIANLNSTSSTSEFIKQYQFVISTGDLRLQKALFPIEFALLRALRKWQEITPALTYGGVTFVKNVEVVTASEGVSDPEKNRGIKGWGAILNIDVKMIIPNGVL